MQTTSSLPFASGVSAPHDAHQSLFITDLDGTLLNNLKEIAGDVQSLSNLIQADKVKFSIATGRSLSEAQIFLDRIKPSLPVALCNGALIYDCRQQRPMAIRSIPEADLHTFIQHYKSAQRSVFIAMLDQDLSVKKLVYPKPSCQEDQSLYNFLRAHGHNISAVDEFNPASSKNIIQLSVSAENLPVEDQLEHTHMNRHRYTEISKDQRFPTLEYVNAQSGKGEAALFIQRLSKAQDVVSFGDNGNDIDMFKVSRLSYAPMNAAPSATSAAYQLIGDHNTGSVIQTILHLAQNELYV